jgi:hypothetical protein
MIAATFLAGAKRMKGACHRQVHSLFAYNTCDRGSPAEPRARKSPAQSPPRRRCRRSKPTPIRSSRAHLLRRFGVGGPVSLTFRRRERQRSAVQREFQEAKPPQPSCVDSTALTRSSANCLRHGAPHRACTNFILSVTLLKLLRFGHNNEIRHRRGPSSP